SPAPSPKSSPEPSISSSPLDPTQLRALQSLNLLPTSSRSPCSSPEIHCDGGAPLRHLISLTISNCSDDVALSAAALKSLSTLTSLAFVNCPISPIRFPSSLAGNLRAFACIRSLRKLTGVWLSRLQNVSELTVSGVSVVASGPSIILGGMKSLQSVTLSQCNLTGILPRRWHPNLTSVDLSENRLAGSIPVSITNLENLDHLNLSGNSLNGTIPASIGDMGSLRNLSLSSNSLSGAIPDSVAALPELTHLDLSSNRLNGTIPNFLRNMKKLKYLNLESNDFHGILPFNDTFIKRLDVFKVGENSNLCYNRSALGSSSKVVKLGISPCNKHGLPISPPPAKDSSSSSDSADDGGGNSDQDKQQQHGGTSKVVLGVAIGLSSVVFLIVFLVCLSKCC
ncbi:hypothetical protein M569_15429, partial [Genlisea aurea]